MKKFLVVVGAASALLGLVNAQTAYVDVPACHWAVTAINTVSAGDKVTPAQSASTAQNAVRQVFEGMQCGDAGWTGRFIDGAPGTLAAIVTSKTLRGYQVVFGRTVVTGNSATVAVNLTLNLTTGVQKRSGSLVLSSDQKSAWRVKYASLVGLNLTVFPK